MNRQWTPTSGPGAAPSMSKETAATAIKTSVVTKKIATQTNDAKFSNSFGKVGHADAYMNLINRSEPPVAAPKPFTGFGPSVALANDAQAPVLSTASQLKLCLVGTGTALHVSDHTQLQAGAITGAGVASWRDTPADLFNPSRRGPTIRFDDDDPVLRHFGATQEEAFEDSESESVADDEDWSEFDKQGGDDVLVTAETSFNNFRSNPDGPTEAKVQSAEELIRLLLAMGKQDDSSRSLPTSLKHVSMAGAELPLWALTLLFGTKSDVAATSSDADVPTAISEAKPVAGSALAAASAILSFRVSHGDLATVSSSETERTNAANLIASVIQSKLQNTMVSLDLSNGALEPRYTPLQTAPSVTSAHYSLKPELYDPDAQSKKKVSEPEPQPQSPEEEEAAAAFTVESSATAAMIILRDALQPTKVRVPTSQGQLAEKLRSLEDAYRVRQGRAKREQRYADRKSAAEAGEAEEVGEVQDYELEVEVLDEQIDILSSAEEGTSQPLDEEYEEALEAVKHSLHKWMDVPPVLANLQALSMANNPTLFLDQTAITAESQGSVDTISEPNVPALEALRSLLQLSGTSQRYTADYTIYNNELKKVGANEGHHERYLTCRLATLLLGNCGLNNSTALKHVAEGLQDNTSLKKISLPGNGFGQDDDPETFQLFADAIGGHKTLESLDISDNLLSADMCKVLAEAIEMSFESHKAAEGEEAPEEDLDDEEEERPAHFEDLFEDIMPAEEEAPTVTVGLPPEEEEEQAEPADAAAEPEAEQEEREETEENEEDEAQTGRPPKPSVRPSSHAEEQEEEPEDEEAAAAQLELELKEAEQAWRQKHEQYIWSPERVLFEFDESTKRRAVYVSYQKELISLKRTEHEALSQATKSEKNRAAKDQLRHKTGWSHLQLLNLSRNPIGDLGAVALASMLRHTVPLSEEDQSKAASEREDNVEKLKRRLMKEKKAELRKRRREEKEAQAEEKLRLRAEAADADAPNNSPFTARGDDRPTIPKLAVPAKNDDDEEDEEGEDEADMDGDADAQGQEEVEEEEEEIIVTEADITLPSMPALKAERPGLRSLHHLNLGMCKIGSKGLKALAATLEANCKALKSLNLARNRFGTKPKKEDAIEADEDAPKQDDVEWVSPGIIAFGQALRLNETLVTLDLSFNKLYPSSICVLAEAFSSNRTLKHLNLRGNYIGFADNDTPLALVKLLGAFTDESCGPCSLESLVLDQNLLGSGGGKGAINEESATLLASLCHSSLDLLSLADNNLTNADLAAFSNALYAMAMDKKTGGKMDGSMSGMGGRRTSITDMTEEDLAAVEGQAVVEDEEDDVEHRLLGNRNQAGSTGNTRVVKAGTSFCVNTSSTLQTFIIDNNQLLKGDIAGTAIARVIQFCSRLHHISIGGCLEIGDSGFNLICLKIGSHPALTILSAPRIGITALEPLTSALQVGGVPLTAIDLGDNDIRQASLKDFCSAISAHAIEGIGNSAPLGGSSNRGSPIAVKGAPPTFDSEGDEEDDDCPPPPFDPTDEDVTPAQSMQRQASRMAILAASTSQIGSPGPKGKSRQMVRYLSVWGRRGLSVVLPEIEPLAANGILEDFFCAPQRQVAKAGPVAPLFDPLLGKDPSQGASVYEQVPSAAYYLHRSVFDGSYETALKVLGNALNNAKEQESLNADKLAKDVEELKQEVLVSQRYLGFGSSQTSVGPPPVVSIPLVNTIRHQIVSSIVNEMRVSQKRTHKFIYSTDPTPAYDEDDQGRAEIEAQIGQLRDQLRSEIRLELQKEKIEILTALQQLTYASSVEATQEGLESEEEDPNASKVASSYAKLIKQSQKLLQEFSAQIEGGKSGPVSPKRGAREEAVEVASKGLAVTDGSLLMLLLGGRGGTEIGSVGNKDEDALRRMRWQCLLNRLAMK